MGLSGSRRMQSPAHIIEFPQVTELYSVQHKEPPPMTNSKLLMCTEPTHNFCVLKSCNCPLTKTRFPPDSEQLSRILREIEYFYYWLVFRCSEHQTCITHSAVPTQTFTALGILRLCGSPLFNCFRAHTSNMTE